MKKILSTILLIWTCYNANSQIIKPGDVLVDIYYGFPDWYKTRFKNDYNGYGRENVKVKSSGHIGIRGEYLVTRRIGIGIDMWYIETKATGTDTYYYYNYDPNYIYNSVPSKVKFEEKLSRFTILGRLLIHLGNSEKVDPYIHIGIGNTKYSYSLSPSRNYYTNNYEDDFPIGFRTGFGARIMFSKHIGANAEVGLGGPLFTTGLSFKF